MTNETTVLAWHFLTDQSTRAQDGVTVTPGATETYDGPLVICRSGLHWSERPLDALRYAQGALIRRVEASGTIVHDESEHADKGVSSVRRELWRADITTLLHEFACWCAEEALTAERAAGHEPDPRAGAAIATKRAWLRGEATDEELDAAWDAARAAAWDAARAAAWDAAWAAARAAARAAAWDAAWAAARNKQNTELERRLVALMAEAGVTA